jgi:hypothetical protein
MPTTLMVAKCKKCGKEKEYWSRGRVDPKVEAQRDGWRVHGRGYLCRECKRSEDEE